MAITLLSSLITLHSEASVKENIGVTPNSLIGVPTFDKQQRITTETLEDREVPTFTDVTALYGISSLHFYRSKNISSIQESISAAVCILDANNDQFQDIFTIGGGGSQREFGRSAWWSVNAQNKLYLNASGKGFVASDSSHFSSLAGKSLNCAAADLDNDLDIDIVVTTTEGHFLFENTLYSNASVNSASTDLFAPPVKILGVDASDYPMHALLTDIDGDGQIDIYSSHFIKYQRGSRTVQTTQGFDTLTTTEFRAELYDSVANKVLLNEGSLKFSVSDNYQVLNSGIGRTIAANSVNLNHDEFPDLLVLNTFDSRSRLFIGTKKGFQEASGDLMQFSIDNMQGFAQSELLVSDTSLSGSNEEFVYITRAAGTKNLLKIRTNDETKIWHDTATSDIDKSTALYRSDWSPLIRDFNLDGYPDIYVASGLNKTSLDSKKVILGQNNHIFWRGKPKGLPSSGLGEDLNLQSQSSRGVAAIDIDNDGVSEVVIANNNGSVRLLKLNTQPNLNWVGISLPQQASWLHAKITLESNDGKTSVYQQLHPQSTFSQHDHRVVLTTSAEPPYQMKVIKRDGSYFQYTVKHKNLYFALADTGDFHPINELPKINDSKLARNSNKPDLSRNKYEENLPKVISKDSDSSTQKARITRLAIDFQTLKLLLQQSWNELHPQTQLWLWHMLLISPEENKFTSVMSEPNIKPNGTHQLIELMALNAIRHEQTEMIDEIIYHQYLSENEQGLDWMLPLLRNSNHELMCKIASVFEHYYLEEEAVLVRKQTALPILIQALEKHDTSLKAKECILAAMGESENQRASPLLLSMLSGGSKLNAAVIQTLGQLKDARAIPLIQRALSEENEPNMLAKALVAMERLTDSNSQERLNELRNRLSLTNYWQSLAYIAKSADVVTFSADVVNEIDNQLITFHAAYTSKSLHEIDEDVAIAQIGLASHRGIHAKHLKAYANHSSSKVQLAFMLFAMQYDGSSIGLSSSEQINLIQNTEREISESIETVVELANELLSMRPFVTSPSARNILERILTHPSFDLSLLLHKASFERFLKRFSVSDKSLLMVKMLGRYDHTTTSFESPLTYFFDGLYVIDFNWPDILAIDIETEQEIALLSLWYSALNSQESLKGEVQRGKNSFTNGLSQSVLAEIQLFLNKTLTSPQLVNNKSKALTLMMLAAYHEPEIVLGSLLELQKKLSIEEITLVAGHFPSEFLASNDKLRNLLANLIERAFNAQKTEMLEQLIALSQGISLRTVSSRNRTVKYDLQ
ncbi:FG-GAP-like repeat-containing protein [Glaciecola sp. MF2-115]|uniref:FG-GAP-like repeat-containing protein n=1 Tax=Glaciecola sp. MF2-115 TaxID=3384827 RepID=UPI0039A3E68B